MTLAARNQSMHAAWKSGLSKMEISRRYGLSKSRTWRILLRIEQSAQESAQEPTPEPEVPMPETPPHLSALESERAAAMKRRDERDAAARRLTYARMLLAGRWSAGPSELADAARELFPHWGSGEIDAAVRHALEIRASERPRVDPAEVEWTPPEPNPPRMGTERDRVAWQRIWEDSLASRPVVRKAREE